MEIKNIKAVKPNRHLFRKIFAIIVSLGVVAGSYYIIYNANQDAKNTVEVIRLKSSQGMTANSILTEDNTETYSIIRKEYTEDMIEPCELDLILNTYSIYYLRGNSILYEDQFTQEKPKKNEWLYEVDYEELLL